MKEVSLWLLKMSDVEALLMGLVQQRGRLGCCRGQRGGRCRDGALELVSGVRGGAGLVAGGRQGGLPMRGPERVGSLSSDCLDLFQ